MSENSDTVILSACRTPIGSFGGAFKDLSAADLGAVVIREAIARAKVAAADVGDVIVRHAMQAAPHECCGILLGRSGEIIEAVPARNLADDPNRFFIDPADHI